MFASQSALRLGCRSHLVLASTADEAATALNFGHSCNGQYPSLLEELRQRPTYSQTPPFEDKVQMTLGEALSFDPDTKAPLNPRGRTGIVGRGLLGKWGPNFAADPIVTRFNPHGTEHKLQFVAIKRRDTGDWAIPGGMVDAGEVVSVTLKREFMEEAAASGESAASLHSDAMSAHRVPYNSRPWLVCTCASALASALASPRSSRRVASPRLASRCLASPCLASRLASLVTTDHCL